MWVAFDAAGESMCYLSGLRAILLDLQLLKSITTG